MGGEIFFGVYSTSGDKAVDFGPEPGGLARVAKLEVIGKNGCAKLYDNESDDDQTVAEAMTAMTGASVCRSLLREEASVQRCAFRVHAAGREREREETDKRRVSNGPLCRHTHAAGAVLCCAAGAVRVCVRFRTRPAAGPG